MSGNYNSLAKYLTSNIFDFVDATAFLLLRRWIGKPFGACKFKLWLTNIEAVFAYANLNLYILPHPRNKTPANINKRALFVYALNVFLYLNIEQTIYFCQFLSPFHHINSKINFFFIAFSLVIFINQIYISYTWDGLKANKIKLNPERMVWSQYKKQV